MLGRSHTDLLAHDPASLVHPDDRAVHDDHMGRLERGELSGFSAEMRFLRPEGEPVSTLVSASVVPDEDGRPLHVIAQVTDLTERHAAERERDRRQLEQSARREAEAVATTLGKLQGVTDVALTHLGFDELVAALLPRVAETLDADAAGIILLDTDIATADHDRVRRGAPAGRGHRARRPDPDAAGRPPSGGHGRGRGDRHARRPGRGPPAPARERAQVARGRAAHARPRPHRRAPRRLAAPAGLHARRRCRCSSLLADRTALAVRHARRYEHERGVVETLQRSLLPPSLPLVPGFTMAARYLPAEADSRVGGDWYDVIVLEGGRVAIAIGDVSGHGIRAAALMGQLRNALRAYAFEGYPPSVAAGRLDSLVRQLESGWFATLAYAVIEPGERHAHARQRRPPLAAARHAGRRGALPGRRDAAARSARRAATDVFDEASYELPPGSLLFFYTDGLVERRGTPLLDSLEKLREVVGAGPAEPEALCEHVRAALLGDARPRDDVAFMAVRMIPLTDERLQLTMPAEPKTLVAARAIVGPLADGRRAPTSRPSATSRPRATRPART